VGSTDPLIQCSTVLKRSESETNFQNIFAVCVCVCVADVNTDGVALMYRRLVTGRRTAAAQNCTLLVVTWRVVVIAY